VPIFDGTLDGWDHFGEGVMQALPGLAVGGRRALILYGIDRTRSRVYS
jgi:hypothetical protein